MALPYCHSQMHLFHMLLLFGSFEVLEPLWQTLSSQLESSCTLEEVGRQPFDMHAVVQMQLMLCQLGCQPRDTAAADMSRKLACACMPGLASCSSHQCMSGLLT